MSETRTGERHRYLTVKEVAEYLGLGTSTIYRLVSANKLQSKKFGNRTKIHPDDLARYERESSRC